MKYLEDDHRFYIPGADGGEDIAEIVFTRQGNDLATIDKTYVDINYRHEGIAEHLVQLVVEKMRTEHRKIKPICPYAKKEFERVSDYYDMRAD